MKKLTTRKSHNQEIIDSFETVVMHLQKYKPNLLTN